MNERARGGWWEAVRRLREEKGWSQGELAQYAGTTQAQVSRIEAGQHASPRADTLAGLAAALGVSVDYLLGLADEREMRLIRSYRAGRAAERAKQPPKRRGKLAGEASNSCGTDEQASGSLSPGWGYPTAMPA